MDTSRARSAPAICGLASTRSSSSAGSAGPALIAARITPRSRSRNSPFAGRTLPGQVVATFLRGRATVLDGKPT